MKCQAVFLSVLVIIVIAAVPDGAAAQIYVVEEEDGGLRYTTQHVPGARLFMETRREIGDGGGVVGEFGGVIETAAQRWGLDPQLVEAVIATESAFDPRARSSKGAMGLMQLMPATARRFQVRDAWNPEENVEGGTRYLKLLVDEFGDLKLALAAYNAGEGAVRRHGGMPPYPETRTFVRRVLTRYDRRSSSP